MLASGEIVTSLRDDPPQPRNSLSPQTSPAPRASYIPMSIVWEFWVESVGWSWQYLTRSASVPAGTSKGTVTYEPSSSGPNEPVMTRSGDGIATPVQALTAAGPPAPSTARTSFLEWPCPET